MDDFISFPKIEHVVKLHMSVTQKIHGTNAQILIRKGRSEAEWAINAGNRTRWLTLDDDNYGFCRWVYDNKDTLIKVLGEGRHYGEWCGKGINNGEGLSRKMFILFDWRRFSKIETPPFGLMDGVKTVPVLYSGAFRLSKIDEIMADLKENGSRLTPPGWFMKPEGIVIEIGGKLYKKVFHQETVKWQSAEYVKVPIDSVPVDHLLQPLRLEKLFSRDERFIRNFPESLPEIVADYIQDLLDEGEITGDEAAIKNTRRALSRKLFNFVKEQFDEREIG